MSSAVKKRRGSTWDNLSLQIKLILIFAVTLLFIVGVNVVVFLNLNGMVDQLEQIYVTNLNLDSMLTSLGDVQAAMTEYLDTKNSDSLNRYYQAEQSFRDNLRMLNTHTSDDPMLIAEKNIYHLSQDYLSIVDETVNAKRGRDVEKYSADFDLATDRYKVVETFIYSLNNARFRANNRDYSVLLTSLKTMEYINLTVLLIAAVLDIVLLGAFTGSIIRPLRDLSDAARKVSEGDFDVTVETVDSEDEIGILSGTFAQMLTSIRQYVRSQRESLLKENEMKERELMMESQVKDAQLKYLQAQINPHFLFNTLNAGAQLAMMEGADKTTVFIDNMASFFRYNISRQGEDATVGEELQAVNNYIYILNVRFSGEIHYNCSVDESLEDIRMPGMILQPIVENAVNYGVRDLDREKMIEVTGTMANDPKDSGKRYLELSVWDNGRGMTKERIEEVLTGDYESDHSQVGGNGIGLGNVMARLALYFGEDGLLDIRSDGADAGTEVIVRIPCGNNEETGEKHV